MVQQIEGLDNSNKENPKVEVQEEMQRVVNTLKLLDAGEAAKYIMYARQHMFEYRDKPGKYLARILTEDEIN